MLETTTNAFLAQNIPQLDRLGNVPQEYRHGQKMTTPGADVSLPNAYLKWYNTYRPEEKISEQEVEESRAFLQDEVAQGRFNIDDQLGFVVLHRCDKVYFLIICTWRNVNELWDTVYVKDLTPGSEYKPVAIEGHKPTFCVWELAPICHEQQAWSRYLFSSRDEQAKYTYLNDRFSGLF